MPWASIGGSIASSAVSSVLGGSKSGERAAKDAAARAQYAQDAAKRQVMAGLSPYMQSGEAANKLLSQYLGTADPEGYARRPTRQQFEDAYAQIHFNKYGTQYNRNSNMAEVNQWVDREYNAALDNWEKGKKEYVSQNPNSQGDGRLLKEFTNEDFVKDPGYEFRMSEGEKGINRSAAARGGYDSGTALKSLLRYNQDYASNEFGNAFNRDSINKSNTYNFLSGQSAAGQNAANTSAGFITGAANNIGQIGMQGQAQANQLALNRTENLNNSLQSGIANAIYGYERSQDRNNGTVSGGYGQTGGYSTPNQTGTVPWYLT